MPSDPSIAPRVRIISTGSEITQGLYPDTNAQRISVLLFEKGFRVTGHAAVPDNAGEIRAALDAAAGCDLIVMTGGLGPTEDDLNREVISRWSGRPLEKNTRAEEMIRERFRIRNRPMPEKNLAQALIPSQALILYNHWGTAPGFLVPPAGKNPVVLALPGPPSEWVPMLADALEEEVKTLFPNRPHRFVYSLHAAMIPESAINEKISDLFAQDANTELTILASRGHIRLRIIVTSPDNEENHVIAAKLRDDLVRRIGSENIFCEGVDGGSLAQGLLEIAREQKKTIASAESCTGGWIAKELTDAAGSSDAFLAGWVTYSNAAKVRDLSISAALIDANGAVSEPVARAMAEGARRISGADYAISVTGIAGPGGGSDDKPVGTVWFSVAGPEGTNALKRAFKGDRDTVRSFAVIQGLDLLRRAMMGHPMEPILP